MAKIYNHAYTIAFEVETVHADTEDDPVTVEELLAAILKRVESLKADPASLLEACGAPYDSYSEEDES